MIVRYSWPAVTNKPDEIISVEFECEHLPLKGDTVCIDKNVVDQVVYKYGCVEKIIHYFDKGESVTIILS